MVDDTERNADSQLARNYIRKNLPQIKGLVAYSSLGQATKGKLIRLIIGFQWGSINHLREVGKHDWDEQCGMIRKNSLVQNTISDEHSLNIVVWKII